MLVRGAGGGGLDRAVCGQIWFRLGSGQPLRARARSEIGKAQSDRSEGTVDAGEGGKDEQRGRAAEVSGRRWAGMAVAAGGDEEACGLTVSCSGRGGRSRRRRSSEQNSEAGWAASTRVAERVTDSNGQAEAIWNRRRARGAGSAGRGVRLYSKRGRVRGRVPAAVVVRRARMAEVRVV